MMDLHTLAERVRKGEPLPFPMEMCLSMAEPLYRLGMWYRLRKPRVRVDAQVISFGNITAGGTGKTPAVIERAQEERKRGRNVAVLTRGYKARQTVSPKQVVVIASSPGDVVDYRGWCDQVGDEAALILRNVPGVAVLRSPDRVAAARRAVDEGYDTLILDDGYQQVQLERNENILVVDAANPFGNGHVLPRGILREPLSAMGRATAICLTRCEQATDLSVLCERLKALCPGIPIRCTTHAPDTLWRVADGALMPLEQLRGQSICAICGIGNPEAFFRTLEVLGARIKERISVPDHGEFPKSAFDTNDLMVLTEKDAMRVPRTVPHSVYALGIRLTDYD